MGTEINLEDGLLYSLNSIWLPHYQTINCYSFLKT